MIEIVQLIELKPYQLDDYLRNGFFRACNMLHRSKIICTGDDILSPINIRLPLHSHKPSKSNRRNLKKNKEKFEYTISDPVFDEPVQRLFDMMKTRFIGYVCDSPQESLYGDDQISSMKSSPFDTKMIRVYDGDKLIACSFFDEGDTSVASIMGLYDDAYKNFGLGKFTMLLEIEAAIQKGKSLYYPGYIFSTDPRMDYKLSLGEYEFRNNKNQWEPISLTSSSNPSDRLDTGNSVWADKVIKSNFATLKNHLASLGLPVEELVYPIFDIQTLTLKGFKNVRNPFIIRLINNHFVEYDLETDSFRLFKACYAQGQINLDMMSSNLYPGDKSYREFFIGYENILFSHKSAEIISQIILFFVLGFTNEKADLGKISDNLAKLENKIEYNERLA